MDEQQLIANNLNELQIHTPIKETTIITCMAEAKMYTLFVHAHRTENEK